LNYSCSEDRTTPANKEQFDEYYNKGLKRYDEQKWAKAIEYFNKALNLDSTNGETYIKLAHSYKNAGNYVESIRAFEKAEALKTPLVYEDYFSLAFNYNNIKQYDKAVEAFNRTIQMNPDGEFSVYLALATSYYNLKISRGSAEL
jgi:tetratricopeptide (TPR) repeat protein